MQIEMNEAVRRTKEEGERKLEKAVRDTEERLNAYYTQKEQEAREEERSAAAAEAERIARYIIILNLRGLICSEKAQKQTTHVNLFTYFQSIYLSEKIM